MKEPINDLYSLLPSTPMSLQDVLIVLGIIVLFGICIFALIKKTWQVIEDKNNPNPLLRGKLIKVRKPIIKRIYPIIIMSVVLLSMYAQGADFIEIHSDRYVLNTEQIEQKINDLYNGSLIYCLLGDNDNPQALPLWDFTNPSNNESKQIIMCGDYVKTESDVQKNIGLVKQGDNLFVVGINPDKKDDYTQLEIKGN